MGESNNSKEVTGKMNFLLEKIMKQFPHYKELRMVPENKRAYGEDGQLTAEYAALIEEFNQYCERHLKSLQATQEAEELAGDKTEMLKGAIEYLLKHR